MRNNPLITGDWSSVSAEDRYANNYRKNYGMNQVKRANNEPVETGFFDAIKRGSISGGASVPGGQADFLNIFTGIGGDFGDYMQEVAQDNQRKKEYELGDYVPFASDYYTNPEGLTYDASNAAGSMAALAAEAAALYYGAGLIVPSAARGAMAVGARSIAKKIATKAAEHGMPWVGKVMNSPSGKLLALQLASTPLEAASEAGNTAREVKGKGGSAEEQKSAAAQDFAVNSAILTFTNALQVGGLGKLIDDFGGKDKFMTVMKGIAGGAVENAYEEGAQQSASEYAQDKNGSLVDVFNPYGWSEEAKNAAAVGGITGGLLGGVGVAGGNKLNNVYQNRENLQQATNEEPYDEGVMDDLLEKKNDKATKQNIPEQNLQGYDSIPDNQLLLLGEGQGDGGVNQYGKGSFNGGLFRKPSEISHQMQGRVNEQLFTQQNDTKPLGFQQTIDALNDSFALPKITNENIKAKGFAKKNHYLNANQKKIQQNIPQQQQYSLNEENTSLVRTATGPKSMGRAGNMFLASQPIANKFDMKNAFDPKQQESVTDVNRAADRLMAEQYINQAFDQRQPFMPQGYGSTTRQEQGQLLANLLNARAASEWDKAAGLTREQRRSNMPFVPQRASLYNGALRRNLERLDRIKPDELPSVSNETTDVNRRAAEIQRLREQVIPQSRENAKKFAAPALLEERGKAKARSISLQARSRVREDAILADERKAKKHAKERYEAVKNDVIGFIVPYKTIKEQLKGVNFLRKSVVEQLHEQLEPIYSELVKGMGHGVTDEWVEKGTYIPTDVGDLIGHPEAGKNSHTADHLRYSNNAPWYQQWFKRYGRKPRKAEIYQVVEDILTNRGDSWAWPDKMYDGSPEANQYLAEVREDIDMKHDYINACDVVKQELKNGKLFTEADYKQVDLPQEVQNAQTEKTAESKGNDENSVLERNPQEQADYQGENKNGEAEEIDKAKSRFEKLKENFRNSLMKLEEAQKEIDKIFDGLLANSPFVKSLKEQADKEIVKMDKEKRNLAREEKVKLLQKATAEALYKDDDLVTAAKTATRKSEFYQEYNQAFFEKINKLSDIGVIISNPIAQRPYMLEFYENVTGTKWDKSQNHKLNEQAEVSAEKAESKPAKKSAASVINDYKHTTKKTMIKAAKLDKDFSDDEFKEAKELAEENGGFYSKYASQKLRTKGVFLFEKGGAEGRDAFIAALNEKFGDKQEASVEPALERGITRDVDAEQNNKARERIAAENKNESQENKGYRTSNRDWGTTVNVKNNEVTISFNKSFGNMSPIKFTVAEYQKAAVSSVNRLSGIRKFLMPKVDAHNQEWIDAAPNENVRLAREDDVAMHGKDLADVIQKLVDTAMEKAGIEAADRNTLFNRAKTKNIESKEDVQKAEVERVAKEVSKEPSLGMYARKGDQADFVRHYMNVAEDTISELGEEEPLSLDSVSTKKLEKMFAPHMVKLYDEIRTKDKQVEKVTESAKQKQIKADFGDAETAANEFANVFGIKRKDNVESKPAEKVFNIVDDSDEALAAALKDLKSEVSKLSANPIFNPDLHRAAFKVGAILIQRGANSFIEWSNKMVEMVGDKIRPWLGSVWKSIEAYPKNEPFDDAKATAATRYVGAKYNEGYTTIDGVYNAFESEFGTEGLEACKGFIDSAFAGIDELYNPTLDTADNENVVQSSKENTAKEAATNDTDQGRVAGEKRNSSEGSSNRGGVSEREKALRTRRNRDRGTDGVLGGKQTENDSTPKETRSPEGVRNNKDSGSGRQSGSEPERRDVHNGRKGASGPVQTDVAREPGRGDSRPRRIGKNYHIDNPDALIGGKPRVRFLRNKKAIEIAQDLIGNDRPVSEEERDALAAYIGWGSFGQELFQGSWENPVYKDGWEDENNWLRETLGEKAWKEAQNSIINAHYTDPYTINAMWEMARQLGFKGGRVLEPSMGVGNFFGLMPLDLAEKSKLTGIELDQTTGRMAQVLYPEANVQIKGYQDSHTPEGFYDLIVGNVPFGNFSIASRKYSKMKPLIHDYFFLKGIDELKPGGIMMAITSKGTMDKADARVRMELARKADLVAAYRLPTGAFDQYAGTNVVTDILVFQKLDRPRVGVSNLDWVKATKYDVRFEGKDQSYYMNDYFKNHSENVLGKTEYGHGTTTGRPGLTVKRMDDFAERLAAIPYEVPKDIFSASNADANIQYISNHTGKEQGSLTFEGDKLYTVYGDVLKPLESTKKYDVKDPKKTAARVQEFKDWMKLRDTLGALYDAERNDSKDMEKLREQLNQQFDDYCDKYVDESKAKTDSPAFRQSFVNKYLTNIHEPSAARVQALVTNAGKKTSIFFKRNIRGNSVDIENPTIAQALIMQRNESMVLDVDRIAELSRKSKAETIKELLDKNIVFKTPAGNYETKDNYLAGNVRQKLREAEEAYDNGDKYMKRNIEELKKVIPPTVPYYQISAPLGSSWIPNETYIDFIAHLLGNNKDGIVLNKTKNYSVSIEKNSGIGTASKIYGSNDVPFSRMLSHAFNHTKPTITKRDSEGNTYKDEQAMQKAADQLEKIYDEFSNWLWKDNSRKIALENAYNEAMNSIAVPTYDGSFMDMPGMALQRGESPFSLRQHQLNAIYRGLLNGSGIYAHEVGTGKTYTMAGLAIESRRYGLAKKPLLLAFNANSASVAKEINDMYPGAKVLYIDNLDRKSIQLRLNQIKTDDWDCVVMPHSLADKLSFREETLNAMAEQQIYELEQAAIAAAKEEDEELTVEDMEKLRLAEADKGEERKKLPYIKSQTAKKLVTMRNQVINQIKQQALNSTDEDAIAFEDLGIDMVMVDEAHAFKKPPFTTTRNIKGLTVTTSNRSIKLSFISQYIQSLHNGKGIHLFTGTPITNTLTEMYHMMKYVMPNAMEDAGVKDFDSWMNSFAEEVSDMEFTSTGDVELVSRLAAFTNVPELRRFVGQYWDTVFADDMPEFKPRETKSGKNIGDKLTEEEQDELVNGYTEDPQGRPYKKVIVETLQLTKSQQEILDELVKKAKNWAEADGRARREIRKTEFHATPLLIGNDASIAAMDPRLYDLNVDTTGEETKKDRCVKNVLKIYNEGTKQHPTVQVIFSDVGYSDTKDQSTPNPEGRPSIKRKVPTFNLSKAIVEDLVKGGIPENEIVVMKASYSAEKRAQIADELKTGKYRVVIGSTATLGVGVNMQDNLRAMHHLDCPWMPGDLVQRNGRGHRQGNHWNTVLEYRYVTEKLDTKRWQTVLRKDAFITSFMKSKVGDVSSRSFEMGADDVGDSAADSDLLKTLAEASGDPRIILQKKYETNLTKLERKERTFLAGIEDMKASLIAAKKGIENAQLAYETSVKDAKRFLDNKPEPFEISLVNSLKPTVKRELVKFDNRTEAQKHLQQILSEVMNIDTDNNIGEYAGFKIIVKKVRSDMEGKYVPEISIKGDQKYTCGTPSVQAITMKPASIAKLADDEKAKKARLEEVVKRLEIAVQEKFPQQEQLDRTKKQLEDVKLDRLMSPTPPPKWLMEGVNVDSMFYVDKEPYILTGYRANSDGYYLVGTKNDGTEKIFPFQDATDIQGMPVYDMAEHVPSPAYKEPKAEEPKYSVDSELIKRTREAVLEEVKKALPTAKISYDSDGNLVAEMPNGRNVGVVIEDKIILNQQQAKSAGKAHNTIATEAEGYWNAWETLKGSNVLGVIHVSRNSRVGTAFHEVLHAAMDLSLNAKEKEALYKHFKKAAEKSDRDIEEEIADGYKEWVLKRQQGQGSLFGKLYKKAIDFLNKLYTMFVNANNVGNTFRKLESGKVWQQDENKANSLKFSLLPKRAQQELERRGKLLRKAVEEVAAEKRSGNEVFEVCKTPLILQKLGAQDLPIVISLGTALATTKPETEYRRNNHHHSMPFDVFEQIPRALQDPLLVLKSYGNSIVVYSDIVVRGKRVTIPIKLSKNAGRYVVNEIKTIIPKDNDAFYIIREANNENAIYIKTKNPVWLGNSRLQLPQKLTKQSSLIDSIVAQELKKHNKNGEDVKYSVAPAKNKIVSTFTNTKRKNTVETFKDWLSEQRRDFYVKWFDKNDRLHDFDKAIEMGVGKKVSEDKKVYSRVQTLPATSSGMATALIEGNAEHIKVINERLKHKKLKHNATMQMVLDVVNKSKMDKLHPSWLKENNFDSWVNALGAYLGSARLLEMNKRAKEEGVEYKLPNGLTKEELMSFIAKAPAEFKKAADLYYKFNDNMLTIMEDAGLISEETHRVLNEKYKHYCPLMRDFSDTAAADAFIGGLSNGGRGIANVSNPLKRISIEGSERNVFNPLESTLKAVSVICNRAERNKVGQMAVELAQEAGLENVVVEVEGDKADEKNCIFTVMQNGKKQAYQTTQELYGPIVGYNLPAAGLMLGVARSAAHLLRTGATMSPSFIVRNLIRDTIFAGVASKNGFVPILDTIRGAQALLKDEKMRAEFETAGITKFNFYNTADEIARSLDEMADNKNWREYTPSDIWKAIINHPTKPFFMTSEFVESATRMGEYLKAREKGLSIEEAARAARELTLDFSRSGVSGEKYNQVVPFFNACLQGGDKLRRLFKEDFLGTLWNVTKYIILPSFVLWILNHDEDWYKEIDPSIKNTNWILPGGIRIPKPQEAGVIFGSGIEAMLDIASGKDKDAMDNWSKEVLINMAPNIFPTVLLPIIEWQVNYSFFRSQNIANRRLQQLPDELQYTNSTSEVSKAIGKATGLSPVKIDNTIRGYTGTMGMFLAQAPDRLVADKRNLPEKKISEMTFLRDFNVTDMNLNRSVDEFYDMLAEANKQHAGYGKKGKPSKVVKSIRTAGKMISDLNKDIQTITNSRLSPSVKRARIDKKRAEIKRIANIAVTKYGKYFD